VRAGQALGLRLFDGDEALPLQALEHRKRRRQWLAALAAMPAPVRDRYLDEGGQELGRCLLAYLPTWTFKGGRRHRLPNKKSLLGGHYRLPGRQRGNATVSRLSLVVFFIAVYRKRRQAGEGMHRRVRISGVEFYDDHHTLAPVFFKTPSSRRLHVPQMGI